MAPPEVQNIGTNLASQEVNEPLVHSEELLNAQPINRRIIGYSTTINEQASDSLRSSAAPDSFVKVVEGHLVQKKMRVGISYEPFAANAAEAVLKIWKEVPETIRLLFTQGSVDKESQQVRQVIDMTIIRLRRA